MIKNRVFLLLVNAVFFALLISVFACSPKGGLVNQKKAVAYFDYFTYEGMDDFYINHPLEAKDEYFNPILPGWYSDPSICSNGEDYFMVTSTFAYFPGVPIFHSKDLINWQQIGHVLNRESQLLNMRGQGTSGGIFAPAIAYNPTNRTYYMITTNVGYGNFFVKTTDPFGEWSDPIALPGVGGIDPSFFFDDDGKAYIVNNDEAPDKPRYNGHRSIRIHQFNVETDSTFGESKVVVDAGVHPENNPIWIEGPHLYKINGSYFLMAAEGGTGNQHSEVIFRSAHPMDGFKPWDRNPILTQRHLNSDRPNPVTCTGHADLIQAKEGDWWAVFLGCRPINGEFENLGRETFLLPVKWSDDGFPYITKDNETVALKGRRKGIVRNEQTTFGNTFKIDPFDSTKLGLEWLTLRTAASEHYSLTENPGFLALKCSAVKTSEREVPAYIGRRLQHHKFVCTSSLYFEPADENDKAGMLLYKDERHQYFLALSKAESGRKIYLEKIGNSSPEVIAAKMIEDIISPIEFKVESYGTHYNFYYSINESGWELLCANIDASYLSTDVAEGFTGTTIGMYAYTDVYPEDQYNNQ